MAHASSHSFPFNLMHMQICISGFSSFRFQRFSFSKKLYNWFRIWTPWTSKSAVSREQQAARKKQQAKYNICYWNEVIYWWVMKKCSDVGGSAGGDWEFFLPYYVTEGRLSFKISYLLIFPRFVILYPYSWSTWNFEFELVMGLFFLIIFRKLPFFHSFLVKVVYYHPQSITIRTVLFVIRNMFDQINYFNKYTDML